MNRQVFKYHPVIGHTYIPGLKARVRHESGGYLVKVNWSGFRSDIDFVKVRRTRSRILVFGDSLTAGDGVSNSKRFTEIAARDLDDVEIFNYGLAGSGTDQQYLVYREFGSQVDHDLVVIATAAENIRRVVAKYRVYISRDQEQQVFAKPYFVLRSDESLELMHSPVPKRPFQIQDLPAEERRYVDRGGRFNWLYRVLNRRDPRWVDVLQRLSRYQPYPGYRSPTTHDWRLMNAILRGWISESPAPVLLFPLPNPQYIEGTASASAFRKRFRELADSTGCHYFDILPDYWRLPVGHTRRMRFDADPHPSPQGHEFVGHSLSAVVSEVLRASGV